MEWISFPDDRLKVHGLAWFDENKPSLSRLPNRLKDTFRPSVWGLAQCPAGGRIRFRTDSTQVGLRAKVPNVDTMSHITRIGQSGFDIYADGAFMNSVSPDNDCKVEADWTVGRGQKMRDITIHMPLYKGAEVHSVGVDEGAKIEAPSKFRLPKPVVFYGTSITQGGCAATPGTTYQNFLSRWLNIDFVNLGFSGNGMGESEVAVAISEIDMAMLVVDHWANIGQGFEKNLPEFIGPIRENHPTLPIAVVSPFYYARDAYDSTLHDWQRKVAEEFVGKMRRAGDTNLHLFDGHKMISLEQTYGLVDGVHPTSLGFYFIAEGFRPYLKKVLSL